MSAVASVPEFAALLTQARLVTPAAADALASAFCTSHSPADTDGFRKFLVARKAVTDYQATVVQSGRTDGFHLAGYTILNRIGVGQTAAVFQAKHPSGQIVALKVLPPSKARDGVVRARFEREGDLLTRCDHDHVVKAFQVRHTGNVSYLVMEYLPGETLAAVLKRRGRLPAAEAVRLVTQALAGLEHLHQLSIVHRDLKPANIMVVRPPPGDPNRRAADTTLDGSVKLLDVGLGRAVGSAVDATPPSHRPLTDEHTLLGTPDYLAPEQARDSRTADIRADIRADIYSLGCVLYHLIAGRAPFPPGTVLEVVTQHATRTLPQLEQVPPGLQTAFEAMTAQDAADRPATPTEAARRLAPFLPDAQPPTATAVVLPAFRDWLATQPAGEPDPGLTDSFPDMPVVATAPPPTDEQTPAEIVPPPTAELFHVEPSRRTPSSTRRVLFTRRDLVMLLVGTLIGFGAATVAFNQLRP